MRYYKFTLLDGRVLETTVPDNAACPITHAEGNLEIDENQIAKVERLTDPNKVFVVHYPGGQKYTGSFSSLVEAVAYLRDCGWQVKDDGTFAFVVQETKAQEGLTEYPESTCRGDQGRVKKKGREV